MRLHFSILIFLLTSLPVFSQHYPCGTSEVDQLTDAELVKSLLNHKPILDLEVMDEIPVQFHIIGSDNGLFALDTQVVINELEIVNDYFADININFKMCQGFNFINNNQLVTFVKESSEWICFQEDVSGAINIYFAPHLEKDDGESICGYAPEFTIRSRVFMDNNCTADGATLTHELGHSFSLAHTHRTAFGFELASGSNCETAGDFLCDTPADPRLSNSVVNTNCQYTGTILDGEQNPYNPDTGNVMSYSPTSCVNNFSDEQLIQMRAFYDFNGSLLNCFGTPASNDKTNFSSIRTYPNPISAQLFIENVPRNAHVQIWNSNGTLVSSFQNLSKIDLIEIEKFYHFSNGVYYLKVYDKEVSFTKKIIKMSR